MDILILLHLFFPALIFHTLSQPVNSIQYARKLIPVPEEPVMKRSCACRTNSREGGRPFHLVPGKPAAYCVVYLFRIGLVTERGHAYESLYGRFRAVVPFAGKQSGEEVARSGRFGKGWREAFGEGHGHAVELHAVHLKDGEHFLIPVKTDLGGTRAQRNRPCKP